jgi:medium-chain acyl-[acyl-carrier-protein] hydrolase
MSSDKVAWFSRVGETPEVHSTVYCLPHAGAGTASILAFARAALPGLDVAGVRLPGRERRFLEPMTASLTEIATALARAIEKDADRRGREAILVGVCSGSAIAAATAMTLARSSPDILAGFVAASRGFLRASDNGRKIEMTTPDVVEFGGFSPGILKTPELMKLLAPIVAYDRSLAAEPLVPYPLPVPILAVAGIDDALTTDDDLASWREIAGASFSSTRIPGGHFLLSDADASGFAQNVEWFANSVRGRDGEKTHS